MIRILRILSTAVFYVHNLTRAGIRYRWSEQSAALTPPARNPLRSPRPPAGPAMGDEEEEVVVKTIEYKINIKMADMETTMQVRGRRVIIFWIGN